MAHIDAHYAACYAVARTSGFDHKKALLNAYGSQFVDDQLDSEPKRFDDGSQLSLHNTGHGLVGSVFVNYDISNKVWICYHFPPSGEGKTLDAKLMVDYKAKNDILKELEDAVIASKDDYAMAILSHIKIDSYSHTHFNGAWSKSNVMYARHDDWWDGIKQWALRVMGITVGHPQIICKVDDPYRKFKMKRASTKEKIDRDNHALFSDALEGLHDLFCRYTGCTDHKAYRALKPKMMVQFVNNTDPDGYKRVNPWYNFLEDNFVEFTYADHYDETLWPKKALILNKDEHYFKSCWNGSELQKSDAAARFIYEKFFEIMINHHIIIDHYCDARGILKITDKTEMQFARDQKN